VSTEKNKAILRLINEHISHGFFYKSPFEEYSGRDGYHKMAVGFRDIFPDFHISIDDIIGEGDKLAIRFTETGTMKGELMGIPPTGRKFSITVAYFYRFVNGKVAEVLAFGDTLTFYQQLGVSPPGQ
jgi:predicted ester cyclase